MQEIKSVRVRRIDLSTDNLSSSVDYKVTLFGDGKKNFKVGVFQPGRPTLFSEYKKEGRFKKFSNDDFIKSGINTLIVSNVDNKSTLSGGGSGMGQLYFEQLEMDNILNNFDSVDNNIAYKIIQDPWLETPPPFRNFGFDPYYINNGASIIIRWLRRNILDSVVNSGGFKWSDDFGNELSVSKNNDSKKLIYKTVEIISPDNSRYYVNFQGSPFFSKGKDDILSFSGEINDITILNRVLNMWIQNVFTKIYDRYSLEVCKPNYKFCDLIPYIDPIESDNIERLEEDFQQKIEKKKLNVIIPKDLKPKVKEDISFKIFLGDPPKSELPTVEGFDFGDEDDLSDLLLDDEFRESEFAGLDESQLEIQEYPDERTRIETQNQAQLINNQPYVPGKYNLDIIPGTFLGNNKENITCCNIDGKPVNIKIADAVLDMKAAAKKDGVNLIVTSGFRPGFNPSINTKSQSGVKITAQSQEELYQQNCVGKTRCSPATASAGRSKHGNGIAVDFNTGSRTGKIRSKLNSDVYSWLVKNSWRFGFVRTVASEEWHFEYWVDKSKSGPYAILPKSNNLFYSDLGLNNLQIA